MICYFVTYQTYSDGIGNLLCQGNQTYTWYFSLIDSWNNTFFFDWAKDYALEFFFDSASNSDFCCAAVLRYHWTKLTWFKKKKNSHNFHLPIIFLTPMEKIQHFFSGCQLKGTAHPIVISANIYNIDSGSNWWLTHFRITQRNIRNYTAYISLLTHTKTNFSWWLSTIYCVLFIKTVLERKLCRIHFAFVGLCAQKQCVFIYMLQKGS